MKYILTILLGLLSVVGFSQSKKQDCADDCSDGCKQKCKIACRLTSPELQQRKATVIANLKKQVIEAKELKHGYSYKFKGDDKTVDELATFVKTERLCCDFFDFNIKVNGDASFAWLTITGPKGTKEFITSELEF